MIVLTVIAGDAYADILALHLRVDSKRVLNIAVFEWRLDDWIVAHPFKGIAKEWLSSNLPAVQVALQAVATSILGFKSLHPDIPVMLMTDLFAKPSSDIHKRVAEFAQRQLLVSVLAPPPRATMLIRFLSF